LSAIACKVCCNRARVFTHWCRSRSKVRSPALRSRASKSPESDLRFAIPISTVHLADRASASAFLSLGFSPDVPHGIGFPTLPAILETTASADGFDSHDHWTFQGCVKPSYCIPCVAKCLLGELAGFGVHHGYSNMLPTLTRTIRNAYHFSQLSMLAASERIILGGFSVAAIAFQARRGRSALNEALCTGWRKQRSTVPRFTMASQVIAELSPCFGAAHLANSTPGRPSGAGEQVVM
jgi:hypothetical protein